MGNIVLLDELTINQIAAGEVVERPASVIKEMVENSIDAGATNINIEIKNGGISYIRISDNGKGIVADDMEIAFERHATSKIRSANDLDNIKSMGFRGEALASIAAISNMEMISKAREATIGNRIVVEAGKVLAMEEAGCPQGTSITVQELFFNTPVRYKFLKKDYTESGYIEDAVTRLALINPNIAFKFINTGKTILQTSGNGKIQDVIYAIYGKDVASAIIEVDYTYEEVHVTGVVGKPEIARSNRGNQLFFVNKRFVKDKTLTSASENSFKGLLPIGKYGFLVLNIDMDPSKVDVNVHPAKLEVRFQEENKIFKAVYHAIKETLLKSELIANVSEDKKEMQPVFTTNRQAEVIPNPKSNITDLFRKIVKNSNKEEATTNNFIEDIYKRKDEPIVSNIPKPKVEEEKTWIPEVAEVIPEKKEIDQPKTDLKTDVFKELLAMQQRLKEETTRNPFLHSNIDKLMQDTQNMEEKIVEENRKEIVEEPKQEETIIEAIVEPIVEENPTIEMPEVVEEKPEITPILPIMDSIILPEENKIVEIEEIKIQELELPQSVDNNKTIKEVEETTLEKEDTKAFTSNEIQEMMDKLTKMEEGGERSPEFVNMYERIFGKLPASIEEKQKEEEKKMSAYEIIQDNTISVFEDIEEYNKPIYKLVGIAFNTYIMIEIAEELYIIDQHAAHERIMYQKVKENYYTEGNKDSQMLLLPDVITLTHKEMDILKDNVKMFEQAGFILEEFGDNTIKLNGVPNICLELDTKELFLETLDEINTVARTAKQEIEEKFIATVACKAAVKAHMVLTKEEVDTLMNDLLILPNPFTCPHGRPTAIKMDKNDIEKKFARRK